MKVTKELKLTILGKKHPDFTPTNFTTPQKGKCLTNLWEYSRQKVNYKVSIPRGCSKVIELCELGWRFLVKS